MGFFKRCLITGCFTAVLAAAPVFAAQELRNVMLPIPKEILNSQKIRVLVVKPRAEVKISSSAHYEIYDAYGKITQQGEVLPVQVARASADGILIGDRLYPGSAVTIRSIEHGIRIGNLGVYGDTVTIRRVSGNKVEVINRIPVDDYLKGVIPFEANPAWSLEALKAQAVASRTYAVFKMIERINEDYDVSSGVYSQVYSGKKIENPKTNQAVDDTRGEILLYKNKVFPGYFHSTCGGRTTGVELVWRVKPVEPLKGVECKFCAKSPHYKWETVFSPKEIKEKMAAKGGIPVQTVKSIRLGKIDASGRAHEIAVGSDWMRKSVDADAFRVWMGPEKLKSNLITRVSVTEDGKFRFRGRGWGHGVGICQYGMKHLGELGYGYREILSYYYPGASIIKLQSSVRESKSAGGLMGMIEDALGG